MVLGPLSVSSLAWGGLSHLQGLCLMLTFFYRCPSLGLAVQWFPSHWLTHLPPPSASFMVWLTGAG